MMDALILGIFIGAAVCGAVMFTFMGLHAKQVQEDYVELVATAVDAYHAFNHDDNPARAMDTLAETIRRQNLETLS